MSSIGALLSLSTVLARPEPASTEIVCIPGEIALEGILEGSSLFLYPDEHIRITGTILTDGHWVRMCTLRRACPSEHPRTGHVH